MEFDIKDSGNLDKLSYSKNSEYDINAEETHNKENDATYIYLQQIGAAPLLTAEQERDYVKKAHAGCIKSRNNMIESNLRLVVKISRKYLNRGLDLLDLVEEGNLGLMHAISKFDPDKGFRFSTYSTWWIRQTIERALMNQSRTIRVPIHVMKQLNQCLRAERSLEQTLDRSPQVSDIAKHLDKSVKDVEQIFQYKEKMSSVDLPVVDGSDKSVSYISTEDEDSDPARQMEALCSEDHFYDILSQLHEKQREVIYRRFGFHGTGSLTLEQVGQEIGLTRERVRQIQIEAIKSLRNLTKKNDF